MRSLPGRWWWRGVPSRKLRVVIADDHPAYRQGLAKVLTSSGIEVVDETANGKVPDLSPDRLHAAGQDS
jgi:DNA-binding NarL/FixJ family response regulator